MSSKKTILSLCDYSGNWSKPYKDNGYDVIQVDILHGSDIRLWPTEPSSKPRLSSEMNDIRDYDIYGVLAAPPCTVFANSGAKHKRSDEAMMEGLELISACMRIIHAVSPTFWCLENPVGKLVKYLGDYKYTFNPYDFGGWNPNPDHYDKSSKKTCLWGDFNIPSKKKIKSLGYNWGWKNKGGKSEATKTARSHTPIGFSLAFYEANK